MKKKYLLGLALLPLCLGGCSSNNELVIYCTGYVFNGTNTYTCNRCVALETDDAGNIVDDRKPSKSGWYVKSVSASMCSYYSNHMHYAVLWSK